MILSTPPPSSIARISRPVFKRWLFVSFVLSVIGASFLVVVSRHDKATSHANGIEASPTTVVEITPVTVGRINDIVRAVGTLEANESVMIRPEIPGLITRILFTEGQAVEKGMALIELDDSELQAHVADAEAQLKIAHLTYDRMMQLTGNQNPFISEQQIDQAISTLGTAKANYALYQTRLAKTRIRAPFAGYVGIRRISPGDYVQPGQDLVNLEDLHTLKIDFKIPETFLPRLSIGQQIEVITDADPTHPFTGHIYVLDPRVDSSSRAVRVRARVPNAGGKLRPGLFANIDLTLGEQANALLVPEEAVIPQRDKSFVYRVQNHTARWTEVGLGMRHGGLVQVLQGLHEGDDIIRVGHHKIKDGTAVAEAVPR
jgi:membrane fusion protein, multidrug efflux system